MRLHPPSLVPYALLALAVLGAVFYLSPSFPASSPPHDLAADGPRNGTLHLCVVTSGLYPLVKIGGVSRAFRMLVTSLASDPVVSPHYARITLLYPGMLGQRSMATVSEFWADMSRVRVAFVDASTRRRDYGSHRMTNAARVRDALSAIHASLPCSVILSHDLEAPAYYLSVDRFMARARPLSSVPIITWMHSQHEYMDETNGRAPADAQAAIVNGMERFVVENSDVLISPSTWYLEWIVSGQQRFATTPHRFRVHNLMGAEARSSVALPSSASHFLYYTRIEVLKGIFDFLAVAAVVCRGVRNARFHVTGFASSSAVVLQVRNEAARINAAAEYACVSMHEDVRSTAQVASLASSVADEGVVVLGVTLADSSSYVLMEMFAEGIPFVTYATGGIPELFECSSCISGPAGDVAAMASRVEALAQGRGEAGDVIRRRFGEKKSLEMFHEIITGTAAGRLSYVTPPEEDLPLRMTVAVTSKDRAQMLRVALASVLNATSRCPRGVGCDVLVLDSSAAEAGYVRHVAASFGEGVVNLVHLPPSTPLTRVRNAAFAPRGRDWRGVHYVCFFDDDDEALPDMLRLYARAARASQFRDVLSGWARVEKRDRRTGETLDVYSSLSLAGPSPTEPLLHFDTKANFCVRRDKALAIGGHSDIDLPGTALRRIPYVDWAFVTKCFVHGLTFASVPEDTYVYVRYVGERERNLRGREVQGGAASHSPPPAAYESLFHDAGEVDVYFAKRRIVREIEAFLPERLRPSITLALLNALPKQHSVRKA